MKASRLIAEAAPPGGRMHWILALPGLALWLPLALGAGWRRGEPLLDPDDYMHVVRLWQVVERGGWAGGFLARDGAPGGSVLHWTMPYDLMMLAVAAPLAPALGWHEAIRLLAPFGALLTGLLLVAAVAWAAAPGGRPAATVLAAMLAATPDVVVSYGALGRDDHHLLILALWVAIGGALWRLLLPCAGMRAGALLGGLSALGGWVALEAFAPGLAAAVALAGLVACDRARWRRAALGFAVVFPAGIGLALLLDPPAVVTVDRLSPLFLIDAALAALAVLVPVAGARLPATLAAVVLAAVLAAPPFLAALAPYPDPAVWQSFVADVAELRALSWPGDGLVVVGPGLVGLGFALWLASTGRRLAWLALAAGQAVLIVLAARHARLALYPCTLGSMIAAAGLARLFAVAPAGIGLRLLRAAATVAVAVAPLLAGALLVRPASGPASRCAVAAAAAAIERERPGAIVLADPDLSPKLLYWGASLRTVAGPYHDNRDGLVDVFHAAGAGEDGLAAILARRQASFMLVCGRPGDGQAALRNRLLAGDSPGWLRPLPLGAGDAADLRLYRVELR